MKYQLIAPPNLNYNYTEQILVNRGIPYDEITHYLNLNDTDINDYQWLGEDLLYKAGKLFIDSLDSSSSTVMIVDSDNDGYTSAALLTNWIHDYKPEMDNNVHHLFHEGKAHGLPDLIEQIYDIVAPGALILIPDAGSNNNKELIRLHNDGYKIIILDHHIVDEEPVSPEIAYIINNQICDYPNKELSGVGVVYQFLRYVEDITGINNPRYTDEYLDLVASGLMGDVMDLRSKETLYLIHEGFKPENIHNPFIYYMWQKNKFKLGENITPMGAAFYIVPFVNAINRSGTFDEKELIFKSMINHEGTKTILSNKRGHTLGETELLVEQAVRTATNVKARQTKVETEALETVEKKIVNEKLLDHKVLLFLLKKGEVGLSVAGLVANKLMAKYQRPVCVLTENDEEYFGSARGCEIVGVDNFKKICEDTGVTTLTAGHASAFGLSIPKTNIQDFIQKTDIALKNMPSEPIYRVDFIINYKELKPELIFAIDKLANYWGKGMEESLIAVTKIEITKDMLTMMKANTLKISLPNSISIIKFNCSDDEYNQLYSENGCVTIDAVCKAEVNHWNGMNFPQLQLQDYNIVYQQAYIF